MSVSSARSYRKAPIDLPPFPFYYVGVITDFTPANIIATFVDQMTSNVSGDLLKLNAGVGEFMYLISPVANGAITFYDLTGGASGGWDGALWDTDDSTVEAGLSGPMNLTLDYGAGGEPWYLYRTDFSNIGSKTFRLTYSRNQFI